MGWLNFKTNWKKPALKVLASFSIVAASATPLHSHPHEFVDMKIEVLFSGAKKVTGMRYVWLFDEFFSAYAIEPADLDGDGKPEQKGLAKLAVEILGNIQPIDYMTKFDEKALIPPKLGRTPSIEITARHFANRAPAS